MQAFADLITIEEYKKKDRPKVVLTWAPHPRALPQAVPNSFADWMNEADVDFVITHPEGYELDPKFVRGAKVEYNQMKAFEGADFIYAKNWACPGVTHPCLLYTSTGACAGNWHHQDISQIHTPCSIKVCLGKSPYQGVGVHIFRAISPADSSGYGACLDHAERTAGTGKGVSVVCCSDERVNILRVVSFACLLLCCGTAEERACQYKCAKDRIGFLHRFAINKYFV